MTYHDPNRGDSAPDPYSGTYLAVDWYLHENAPDDWSYELAVFDAPGEMLWNVEHGGYVNADEARAAAIARIEEYVR